MSPDLKPVAKEIFQVTFRKFGKAVRRTAICKQTFRIDQTRTCYIEDFRRGSLLMEQNLMGRFALGGADLHANEIVVKTALDLLQSVGPNTRVLSLFYPKNIIPKMKDTLRKII